MVRPQFVLSLAMIGLGGCAFFAALSGQDPNQTQNGDPTDQRSSAEEAARAQKEADFAMSSELAPLREAAKAETATLDEVVVFVEKAGAAIQSGAIQRGYVSSEVPHEARAALDRQFAAIEADTTPEANHARATIEMSRGYLLQCEGRNDEAAAPLLAAVNLEPTAEAFNLLAALPKSPTTDAAVSTACPLVRPAIVSDGVPDFIAVCLDAAAGDRSKITWKSAKADFKAHDVEMQRREEEAARIAAEEARLAAEAEAAAAQAAAQVAVWSTAAVFGAGRCRFQNCLTDGWEANTDQGTSTTTCRFQNCLKDGWETRFPDGNAATTTCRFQDCMKDGWETRFPDGSSGTTTCRFQNCPVDGWETQLPDGSTATTTCRFQNCFKDGWETRFPDGGQVTCTCKFQDCLTNGTDCN